MFGFGKNKDKKSKPTGSATEIGKGEFPIHTMQDDLDNLRAGTPADGRQMGEFSPNYNSQAETESNVSQMQDATPPPKKSDSPFLNGPAAATSAPPSSLPQTQSQSQEAMIKPEPTPASFPSQPSGSVSAPNDEALEQEMAIQGVKEEFDLTKEDMESTKGSGPKVKAKINWKLALIVSVIFVCLLVFLGGGYYFWMTRSSVETEITNETVIDESEPSVEVVPEPEKFSTENPNPLSIDTEDLNANDIGTLLMETASEVSVEKISSPVEFVVADANGNPLAFHMFANHAGIDLSSEVLNNLEDDFSLYVYSDQGNERLGLAVLVSNPDSLKVAMDTEEEGGLVDGLSPLFLGASYQDEDKFFASGKYREKEVRYINLNTNKSLSIDYTILEKGANTYLIIGTSMKTNQSIINKISAS